MKGIIITFSIVFILVFSVGVVLQPAPTFAQTAEESEEARIAELKAMVNQLITLIAQLQQQLFSLTQARVPFLSNQASVGQLPFFNTPQCGQKEIAWDKVSGAREYVLFRNGVEVYEGKDLKFLDTGLVPGVTYHYTVRAKNAGGLGPASLVETVTASPICPPVTPFITTAKTGTCGGNIQISWNRVAGATFYELFRGNTRISGGNATTVIDRNLRTERDYTYKVRAGNSGGLGEFSAEAKAKSSAICPPDAPEITEVGDPFLADTGVQEGILLVEANRSPSGATIESGKRGTTILSFRAKAELSAIVVERVDVEFSDRAWLFLKEVQIRDGSRVLASVDAEQNNFAKVDDNRYRLSFSGFSARVSEGRDKNLSVFAIAEDNLALTQPREIQVSIPANSVRGTDEINISHTGPTVTFSKPFFVKREVIKP